MDPRLTNPEAVAALGEKIYSERYRKDYEHRFLGQFVVIDIQSEEAFVAPSPEEAVRLARGRMPDGVFHMIRIGEAGAFRVSYTARAASRGRLL